MKEDLFQIFIIIVTMAENCHLSKKKKGKAKRKLCKNKKIKICKPKGDYSKKLNKKCDANKKATTEVNYQGLFLPTDRPEVDWYYL